MLLKAVKAAKVAMMQQHQNTEGLQGQQSAAAETCTWMVPKKTPLALLEAAIACSYVCRGGVHLCDESVIETLKMNAAAAAAAAAATKAVLDIL